MLTHNNSRDRRTSPIRARSSHCGNSQVEWEHSTFYLAASRPHSSGHAGLLAEVFLQERAVLDGGIRVEDTAGVGEFEVQRAAIVRAGLA